MPAVIHKLAAAARRIGSPNGDSQPHLGPTRFSVAARALWPVKTAEALAARCNVGVGTAKHWLRGDREPSLIAVAAVVDEITREFR